eukprot:SAG11_NODE_652_length_7925_cov_3.950166_13_plen_103_part_00
MLQDIFVGFEPLVPRLAPAGATSSSGARIAASAGEQSAQQPKAMKGESAYARRKRERREERERLARAEAVRLARAEAAEQRVLEEPDVSPPRSRSLYDAYDL